MGILIAGILGLVRKGKFEQASDELGKIYYDMLKEDSAFFRSIPSGDLTERLLKDHNYTNGHLEILAELFNAEAELQLAKGKQGRSSLGSLKNRSSSLNSSTGKKKPYIPKGLKRWMQSVTGLKDCIILNFS